MLETFFDPRFSISIMSWVILIPVFLAIIVPLLRREQFTHSTYLALMTAFLVFILISATATLLPFFRNEGGSDVSLLSSWFGTEETKVQFFFGMMTSPAWGLFVGLSAFFGLCILYLLNKSQVNPIWISVGMLFSLSSVGLAWASATFWTLVLSYFLSTVSVLILLATNFSSESTWLLIKRVTLVQVFGIFLILFGAVISVSNSNDLIFRAAQQTTQPLSIEAGILIWLGMLLHLSLPLAISRIKAKDAQIEESVKAVLTIFPTLVSAAAIWKLAVYLDFPDYIKLVLGASVFLFTVWTVLSEWQNKNWIQVWFCCSSVTAVYAGLWSSASALLFMISVGLGFFSYMFLKKVPESQPKKWIQLTLCWLMMSGPLGISWAALLAVSERVGVDSAGIVSYIFLEFSLLILAIEMGSQLYMSGATEKESPIKNDSGVAAYLAGIGLLLLLSFPWTGSFLGGVPSQLDIPPIFGSWFSKQGSISLVDNKEKMQLSEVAVLLMHSAIFIFSLLFVRWVAFRKQSQIVALSEWVVGVNEKAVLHLKKINRVEWASEKAVRYMEQYLWGVKMPRVVRKLTRLLAGTSIRVSGWSEKMTEKSLVKAVSLPGKALQLVQNGNVHWYISITVLSTVLLFYRFSKSLF